MSGTIEENKAAEHDHANCADPTHNHGAVADNSDDEGDHKASKGEKKFKKAIAKMGLKPVEGIERVTFRTQKDFIVYIDNPEVVTTGSTSSYIIFGEAKFLEFDKPRATGNVAAAQEAINKNKPAAIPEEDGEEDTEEAGDIPEESIKTLIEYTQCSRAKAIKCLKKTKGEVVEAITLAS